MTTRKIGLLALAAFGAHVLMGCGDSGSSEVSKTEDDKIRNNMTRSLTPEEIARMGGNAGATSGSKENPPSDAAKPPQKDTGQ